MSGTSQRAQPVKKRQSTFSSRPKFSVMTLDTIVASIIAIFEFVLIVYQWKERNKIKAKEEVWNKNIQSIGNITAKVQERIDKREIQDAKELRGRIEDIGQYANGIHASLKEELKIRD